MFHKLNIVYCIVLTIVVHNENINHYFYYSDSDIKFEFRVSA